MYKVLHEQTTLPTEIIKLIGQYNMPAVENKKVLNKHIELVFDYGRWNYGCDISSIRPIMFLYTPAVHFLSWMKTEED